MIGNANPGIIALLGGISVFLFLYAIYAPKKKITKDTLSDDFFSNNGMESPATEEATMFDKYIRPALRNFLPQSPLAASLSANGRSKVEQLLIRSGNPYNLTPEEYYGVQIMFTFIGFIAGVVLGVLDVVPVIPPVLLLILLTAAGYFIPFSIHNSKRESRSKEIQRQLPEALDLLVVTLTSGSNFEPALKDVSRRIPNGLLKEELTKISTEIQSGRSVESSLTSFANRAANDEAESFAKSIVQSQRLGSDVSETLAAQAASARGNYEALLERKTARLQTTLFIPLVVTMLPALMIVVLAPTLSQLAGGLL